jgi:hypothetical protein
MIIHTINCKTQAQHFGSHDAIFVKVYIQRTTDPLLVVKHASKNMPAVRTNQLVLAPVKEGNDHTLH